MNDFSESIERMSIEDRILICEIVKNSPKLTEGDNGMTAFEWILEYGDGIYRQIAELFKAVVETM